MNKFILIILLAAIILLFCNYIYILDGSYIWYTDGEGIWSAYIMPYDKLILNTIAIIIIISILYLYRRIIIGSTHNKSQGNGARH